MKMRILKLSLILLCSLLFHSCFITGIKKIRLFPSMPDKPIAIKENLDSGFTFYFERDDVKKSIQNLVTENHTKKAFCQYVMKILDSLQERNGLIYETTLGDSLSKNIFSPHSVIMDIKKLLIPKGKVCVMRPDSSFVTLMISSIKKGFYKPHLMGRLCSRAKIKPRPFKHKVFYDHKSGEEIYLINISKKVKYKF